MSADPQDAGRFQPPVTPLGVPADAGQVLLFGGVFDPPHRAHTALAAEARERGLGAGAWLVFVPAAQAPLKRLGPRASDQDRIRMLQLAAAEFRRTAVWTDELDRARTLGGRGPSYWIDTLRRARAVLPPKTELRFLIGADQAVQFHRWRQFRGILELSAPMVMLRAPGASADDLIWALRHTGVWTEDELEAWRQWIVPMSLAEPSSTAARDLLRSGDEAGAAQLLNPAVLAYIRERGLYREGGEVRDGEADQ